MEDGLDVDGIRRYVDEEGVNDYDEGMRRYVNADHLNQMMLFKMENSLVRSSIDMIAAGLLRYGVGVFFGDALVKELPRMMERWIKARMDAFVRDAVGYMSCLGFFIYEVNPTLMQIAVTDPRLVTIEMKRVPGEEMVYKIESRDLGWRKKDVEYYIHVMSEPDIVSGLTQGLLTSLVMQHQTDVILTRNAVVRDTANADATFLLETNASKTEETFLQIPNDATGMFGGEGATIAGISRGMDVVEEARDAYVESTFMLDTRVIRNMELEKSRKMYRMWTRMRMTDVNPNNFGMIPLPAGKTARQRQYPPSNQDYVSIILHMGRLIVNAFGIPYSMMEAHTGNHSSAIDTEDARLQATCTQYRASLDEILDNVSAKLFNWAYEEDGGGLPAILERVREGGTVDDQHVSKKARLLVAELEKTSSEAEEPMCLRIVHTLPLRDVQRGYENGIFKHEALIESYGLSHGCAADMFETRDVRPIMNPDAGAAPGHHGSHTLSKSHRSEQKQSKNPTTSLKRKRAIPGAKKTQKATST